MQSEAKKRPEIFLPPPPTYLTRFYGITDYGIEVFKTKSVTFIHVSSMNDPFDPYFEFINDFDDRYSAILRWIKDTHGTNEVRWFKRILPYDSWEKFVKDIKKKNAGLRSSSFLFCASAPNGDAEPHQNLYMWGHYCKGHRGIAIEFDAERLSSSVVAHQESINPKWSKETKVWTPVLYRETIERLAPADFYNFLRAPEDERLDTKLAIHFNTVSRTKSIAWQLEQEWRLMWSNDQPESRIYTVPILPDSVHRVFIGLRVPNDLTACIAAECRAAFPKAQVLKSVARPGEFALDFHPV